MKKKGFTLIELLAVIVVLAIIALIATPMVLNTIGDVRKGAAIADAYVYASEVEKYMILSQMDASKPQLQPGVSYQLSSKKYEVASLANPDEVFINDLVEIKGDKPTSGYVVLSANGKIEKMEMVMASYPIECKNDVCEIKGETVDEEQEEPKEEVVGGPTQVLATNGETYKAIVYLDPTDLTRTCDSSNSVSTTGTKTGCMKWYAYKDDGTNYTMILDHNTTAYVAWNSENNNNEMKEIKTELDNLVSVTNWKATPRLIKAEELAQISGNTKFTGANSGEWFYLDSNNQNQTATSQGTSKYAWLYDYTNGCTSTGCNVTDSNVNGYWTSTPVVGNVNYAWLMWREGKVDGNSVGLLYVGGVRPVITISKDILK